MNLTLAWLRYIIYAASVVGTILSLKLPLYDWYMIYFLLILFITRARELWLPITIQHPILFIETAFITFFVYTYGGYLYLLYVCSAISYIRLPHMKWVAALISLQIAALYAALSNQPLHTLVHGLSTFVISVSLLIYIRYLEMNLLKGEILNDELRKKHHELINARKTIMEYAKKVENTAQFEERNRISREIHDDLGHKLIRLKMMMEAGLHILPADIDKATSFFAQVKDQLAESMEVMRRTVRKLQPHEADRKSYSLQQLIEDSGHDLGIRVHYSMSGIPYPIYPSEEAVLYRNTQEAMTNAIRHGKATEVWIHMKYEETQIILAVENNGALPSNAEMSKGLGLSGMEERLKLLGGKLKVDCDPSFRITSILPHVEKQTSKGMLP